MNGDIFLDPEKILNEINLKNDMIAADFGCGSGGFTIPLAKKLEKGLVYAIDVQKEPLSALKNRSLDYNLLNLKFIIGDIEKEKGSRLNDSSVDLILIINTLFQSDKKDAILKEAKRVLKNNGEVLIIDWIPNTQLGPKQGTISLEELKKIGKEEIGFNIEKEFEAGKYHYGIIFKKTA